MHRSRIDSRRSHSPIQKISRFRSPRLARTLTLTLALCGSVALPEVSSSTDPAAELRPKFVMPRLLELAGPLAQPKSEVSSMAWKGDTLVVLPQFPTRFGDDGGLGFFSVDRSRIEAAVDGTQSDPILPRHVTCDAPGLAQIVRNFDGLEALVLLGDHFFLTVEAGEGRDMAGYLLCARFEATEGHVSIDTGRFCQIPFALRIPNFAEETLVALEDEVFTIGEANGRNVNPKPEAKRFSPNLEFLGTFPMPHIEYRITDATAIDEKGRFWVINYFWPPERDKLDPAPDPEPWPDPVVGVAEVSDGGRCIERLLELRLVRPADGAAYIERTETPPIYLIPQADGECRNWEAIVRLGGEGFLLMTDRFPTTLLAYIPDPFALSARPTNSSLK